MRTTLNLADGLMAQAKARAAATGRTVTALIEEGLRLVLQSDAAGDEASEPLPTYGSASGRFLVDLEDRDAVWSALEDPGGR